MEDTPSVLKVMGCVSCMKFADCQQMECGCLLCKTCETNIEELTYD